MKYTYFFSFLLFFSCNSNKLETDLANLQKELASAKEKISQLQGAIYGWSTRHLGKMD